MVSPKPHLPLWCIRKWRPAKLSRKQHEGVLQQSSLMEVVNQGCNRSIDSVSLPLMVGSAILMTVPAMSRFASKTSSGEQLNKTNTPLHQAACD